MVGPECRTARWLPSIVVGCLLLAGCSSIDTVKPLEPPAGTSPSGAELPAAEAEPTSGEDGEDSIPEYSSPQAPPEDERDSTATAADAADPEADSSLVVIDSGTRRLGEQPATLVEAAEAERQRRQQAPPTEIVITDKNLSEYAVGQLTIAEGSPSASEDPDTAFADELRSQEEYWRGRARTIRQAWRDAYDEIEQLEGKVFRLRQDFYREDDGFYRDSEIKPAWDRAIEQLEDARAEVVARQEELEAFLEEGRAAGALPGWLREGIELEPAPVEPGEPIAEPAEPVVYEPDGSDPR